MEDGWETGGVDFSEALVIIEELDIVIRKAFRRRLVDCRLSVSDLTLVPRNQGFCRGAWPWGQGRKADWGCGRENATRPFFRRWVVEERPKDDRLVLQTMTEVAGGNSPLEGVG